MPAFAQNKSHHATLSKIRMRKYADLFGAPPVQSYPYDMPGMDPDGSMVDVLIYEIGFQGAKGSVYAAVTNGLSDFPIFKRLSGVTERCELIQYFYKVRNTDVARLCAVAEIAIFDKINLTLFDTLAAPAIPDRNNRPHSLFLNSLLETHQKFRMTLEGDKTRLLWHVPISDEEREYKVVEGIEALTRKMAETEMPWISDEKRAPLVPTRNKNSKRRSSPTKESLTKQKRLFKRHATSKK